MVKLYIKYFLFIYILAVSGFEYFYRVALPSLYLLFPFVVFLFYNYGLKFDKKVFNIILPFFLVLLLQTIFYDSPIRFAFALVIRFLVLYYVAKIIGDDFIRIYINTIKVIAFISILFYGLEYIPPIKDLMLDFSNNFVNLAGGGEDAYNKPNFIIYALQTDYEDVAYIRNAGPFWEPGVFVIFLNIALFFNLQIKKKIFESTNILFIICIITSFSTSGYISLLANIIFFTQASRSISIFYRLFIILVLLLIIPAIYSLPFMSEKVNNQIEQSDVSYSRFGAAVVHWRVIQDYPLTGLPYENENSGFEKYTDTVSPNGITEIFVTFGIIGGLFYYFYLYKSAAYLMTLIGNKNKAYMLFLILVMLIFSETMENRPIYLLLLFLPCIGYSKINSSPSLM